MPEASTLNVGLLAYPGCFASEIFGVIDVLTMSRHLTGSDRGIVTEVLSPRRQVRASGGSLLETRPVRNVDLLVVPGFETGPEDDIDRRLSAARAEHDCIAEHVAAGRPIVSICVGAFLLGEAGALDNRTVTTSWLFADALARRFPGAHVDADRLVVTDGGVTTTAAFSAMYDFVLGLVARHHGPKVARRTARIALLDDARSSQAPYVDARLLPPSGSGFVADVQRHLERHLGRQYRLTELAEHFHVSARTLLRRYREATGETPQVHLQRVRVRRAQHLLTTTDRTVGQIAQSVGYTDVTAFNRVFLRYAGLRPRAYRERFSTQSPVRLS